MKITRPETLPRYYFNVINCTRHSLCSKMCFNFIYLDEIRIASALKFLPNRKKQFRALALKISSCTGLQPARLSS